MNRHLFITLAMAALGTGYAMGQHIPAGAARRPAPAPDATATQPAPANPALPAGHPPLPGMGATSMPAGHPPIGGNDAKLPAGHPPVGGSDPKLPAGHPQIPGMAGGKPAATAPATQRAEHITLAVNVALGSKNARPLPKTATLELYTGGKVHKKIELALDDKGAGKTDKIPLTVPVLPVLTVQYAGIDQQAVGPVMDGRAAEASIPLTVVETTRDAPPFTIPMRHLMVSNTGETLQIRDMVGITNPSDRAWLGPAEGPRKNITLAVRLPEGVDKLDKPLGGDEQYSRIDKGELQVLAPLFPGDMGYKLDYHVDVKDGKAFLTVTAPADTEELLIVVPEGTAIKAEGLKEGEPADAGMRKVRMFTASKLKAGQTVSMRISGIVKPAHGAMGTMGGKKPEGHP